MRRKKEDYLIIAIALTLLFVVFGIAYVAFTRNSNSLPEPTTIIPTKANNSHIETPLLSPTEVVQKAQVTYDTTAQDKLLNRVENRIPLSQEDSMAKASLLSSLPSGQPSGIIYTTNTISIDYTESADLFQVEILTTNIPQAKAEATVWLQARGISHEAMCNLPVMFYLNYDVKQGLNNANILFSPLAEGC